MKQHSCYLPLYKGVVDFSEFSPKKGGGVGSDFSHKKIGVGEIGVCFEKWGITYFIPTNPIFL